jgi:hypothetical protein
MDDLSIHINVLPCLHRNIVLDTTGGMHFSAGEAWDDIQERLLCLDCLQYVTEAEVRFAQHNYLPKSNQTIQMEISHDRT